MEKRISASAKIYRMGGVKIALVTLRGKLDILTLPSVEKYFRGIRSRKIYHMVVDLSKLVSIAGAGWGFLLIELKKFRKFGGDIRLLGMSPEIFEVFQLLGVNRFFCHYSEETKAIRSFAGKLKSMEPPNVPGVDSGQVGRSKFEIRDIPEGTSCGEFSNDLEYKKIIAENIRLKNKIRGMELERKRADCEKKFLLKVLRALGDDERLSAVVRKVVQDSTQEEVQGLQTLFELEKIFSEPSNGCQKILLVDTSTKRKRTTPDSGHNSSV
jgi:anti-anti-sigma factor